MTEPLVAERRNTSKKQNNRRKKSTRGRRRRTKRKRKRRGRRRMNKKTRKEKEYGRGRACGHTSHHFQSLVLPPPFPRSQIKNTRLRRRKKHGLGVGIVGPERQILPWRLRLASRTPRLAQEEPPSQNRPRKDEACPKAPRALSKELLVLQSACASTGYHYLSTKKH